MTSQKRFRHQENSNSGSRSREVPPRFKRQKSSSGQVPLAPRALTPPASQLEKDALVDTMTKQSQIQSPVVTSRNGGSSSQAMPQRGSAYSVLPQYDYVYTDVPSTSMSQQVFHSIPSHQMWPTSGYSGFQSVMLNHNSVMLPPLAAQVNHPQLTETMPYINENCAPSPSYYITQCSPMSPWSTSGYGSPYQSSCSSPAPTVPSPAPASVGIEQVKSPQPAEQQAQKVNAQYIDPDLRTIEMLRELERVADKESQEAEEEGSDRKPPMSHHLRMLACAMDRYTESIEDEVADSSRNDDSESNYGSNKSSPSVSPVPLRKASVEEKMSEGLNKEEQKCFWTRDQRPESAWAGHRPVLGLSQVATHMQRAQAKASSDLPAGFSKPLPQMSYMQNNRLRQQNMSEWNLWSGPSFDFNGILGCPPGADGVCPSFDVFQDACFPPTKERKPLYKR